MTSKRNLVILFITIVVMMIGFGIVIPILPFYIESLGVSGRKLGLLMASFALMQLIFSPVWGGSIFDYNLMLPYISGAVVMAIGLATTFVWLTCRPRQEVELEMSQSQVQV